MSPIPIQGNMNETEAWSGFVPLRPGSHVVRCTSAKEGTTKKNGHPQIELELEAIAGEERGASIRDWITVIPSTYGKVRQVLEGFGLPLPSEGGSVSANAFVGKTCKVIVRPEEKNDGSGDFVDRVKGYKALTDDDAVDSVKEAFGGEEIPGSTGVEEDIPF